MTDIERQIEVRDRHVALVSEPGIFADPEQMDFNWLKAARLSGSLVAKFTTPYANRAVVLGFCLDDMLEEASGSEDWQAWRLKNDREGIIRLESPEFIPVRADSDIPVTQRQLIRRARIQLSPPHPKSDRASAVVEMFGAPEDTDPGGLYRGPAFIWRPGSDEPVEAEIKGLDGKFSRVYDHGRGWPIFNSGMKTILSAYAEFCPSSMP